jgi:hypothetical protein
LSIRAAAIPPAVGLPVSDTWGHPCAEASVDIVIHHWQLLLDAYSGRDARVAASLGDR